MSTPTTRRAPHNCASSRVALQYQHTQQKMGVERAYLAGHPTFVAAYIKHTRVGEEIVG